jgi:hypothetical protein
MKRAKKWIKKHVQISRAKDFGEDGKTREGKQTKGTKDPYI